MTNEQLYKMLPIGVRIKICVEGWQATIVRWDPISGRTYMDSWPLRKRFRVAVADARRCAPEQHISGAEIILCRLGLRDISSGSSAETSVEAEALPVAAE